MVMEQKRELDSVSNLFFVGGLQCVTNSKLGHQHQRNQSLCLTLNRSEFVCAGYHFGVILHQKNKAAHSFQSSGSRHSSPVKMGLGSMLGNKEPDEITLWIENNLDFGKVTERSGGASSSWASSSTITTESGVKLFVKTSSDGPSSMFEGEAKGLQAMQATGTLKIPTVYHCGPYSTPFGGNGSFIVMEYLELGGRMSQRELGEKLARMHLAEPLAEEARQGKFGFPVDNTIGGTFQPNGWMDSWLEFLVERRLRHQAKLSRDSQMQDLTEKVCERILNGDFFDGVGDIQPSILHGDLWSGNVSGCKGQPVIFDPACYYGHHEAEFGMDWCASFSGDFWEAYNKLIPRKPGYKERHQIYTAYHYMNHYNLFGGGYYQSAISILKSLVSR
uniref:protein-ribulosamine 3-kinase n=1 Tax=Timspurckia oligopyrenoides TaxID=708627 RepID=A0A7S0ZIW0_9RHOD|mmetsp:Transcript_6793/g.12143  ORF Transcript_6793/g.12143 Transcript_6793/m.12143 type:complete len:389 (+) Transcript_6793:43-1209(+)